MTEWNPFWIKSQSASLFNPQAFATFLHSLRIEICIDVVFHLEMTMSIQEAGNGWRQASSTALPGALPCWRRPALWRPRASPSLPLEKYWWVHFQSHHRHQKCFFLKKRRENAGSNSRKTNKHPSKSSQLSTQSFFLDFSRRWLQRGQDGRGGRGRGGGRWCHRPFRDPEEEGETRERTVAQRTGRLKFFGFFFKFALTIRNPAHKYKNNLQIWLGWFLN